jgi:nicotinamide mononucleotide (NMN) deamidase PncC
MEFSKVALDRISYYLRERNETICIAESVISGFLQLAFSQMPCAEEFYNGRLTTKTMAVNVAEVFDTDWSIATTGYSTPVSESKGEIFAYFAMVYKGNIVKSDRIDLHSLTRPLDAQQYFMEYVLTCLRYEVKKNLPKLTTKY